MKISCQIFGLKLLYRNIFFNVVLNRMAAGTGGLVWGGRNITPGGKKNVLAQGIDNQ